MSSTSAQRSRSVRVLKMLTLDGRTNDRFYWKGLKRTCLTLYQLTTLRNNFSRTVDRSVSQKKTRQLWQALASTSMIIIGQQHQHTFKNDMHIQLFLSRHFYLLYLPLNSCHGNDAKQRIFPARKTVGGSEKFSLADVQSDVILPSCFLHWPTALSMTFCNMLDHVSMRRCFKSLVTAAGIADRYLYCAHVPALVHKFCSQPDCLADTDPAT